MMEELSGWAVDEEMSECRGHFLYSHYSHGEESFLPTCAVDSQLHTEKGKKGKTFIRSSINARVSPFCQVK